MSTYTPEEMALAEKMLYKKINLSKEITNLCELELLVFKSKVAQDIIEAYGLPLNEFCIRIRTQVMKLHSQLPE